MKKLLLMLMVFIPSLVYANGKLLIAGGAIASDNKSLYEAFIDAQPSNDSLICIIPVASGSPVKSAESFKQDLIRYGLRPSQICVFPLAVTDDKSTDFDERLWQGNAFNESLFDPIKKADGFWFTGGDQMRIVESLYKGNKPSPLLMLLQNKLKKGAVIGGTSAGAAIMSDPMIAAGDSFSALTQAQSKQYYGMETQEKGQLYLHRGLGFFPYGLVDQHFDRKARLGRLIRALTLKGNDFGFAVDENTGMLVDLSKHSFTVVGSGNVTLLDISNSQITKTPFSIKDVALSVLSNGDEWNIKTKTLTSVASMTKSKEYYSEAASNGAGMALANPRLSQLLGFELMDNKATSKIERYSFVDGGKGLIYRFKKNKNSQGYWLANGTLDQYTVTDVYMDIEPITVTISH